jgi:iron complex outermembrane receptor protein
VGYVPQEIVVQPGATVNVAMESESMGLDEVLVIGYGTQKKDDNTGAVTALSTKEFNQGQITSSTGLIAGKVAGVQVTSGGGAPGEGNTIRIRGGASLSALNDPLVVIDGVAMNNDGVDGGRNILNSINPNDIETFNVLKDASATAIYGSRASNGVIIITTKKGRQGTPLQFTYNGNFTYWTPTRTTEVFNAEQFRDGLQRKIDDGFITPSALNLLDTNGIDTDWQDEIFKNAFGQDHYLSARGSTKHMPYRVSLGYTDQEGILLNDRFSRFTGGFSLDPKFLDDHLTVNLNGLFSYTQNRFADRGAIGGAVRMDPTKPIYNDSTYVIPIPDSDAFDTTNYGGYYAWLQENGLPVTQATTNPVALLNMREDRSQVRAFVGNVKVDYKLHPLPQLKFSLNLGTDRTWSDGTLLVPYDAAWSYDIRNGGGENNNYNQQRLNDLLDFYGTWDQTFDGIKSRFELMGGYSWQHFKREDYSINQNIPHRPTDTLIQNIFDNRTEYYLVSFYGRFNYTFDDRFLLTATLRYDGTSRFAEDNRWGAFPSFAAGWKMHNESWLRDSKVISQLKLRAGWGITGQQALNEDDNYPYLPRYTASLPTADYQLGFDENGNPIYYSTLRAEGYDADIKWEETTTLNLGADVGFAEDRYTLTVDWYQRQTKDLINFIAVPAGSNLTNFLLTNVGNMDNQGFEVGIMTRPIVTEDWYWDIGANYTWQENKITKLTASDDPEYPGDLTGDDISGGVGNKIQINSVGFPARSFYVYEQVYDDNGKPIEGLYVDRNGDGVVNDQDLYQYQNPAARHFVGINSRLRWKALEFSFSGRANFGLFVYNNVAANAAWEGLYRAEGPYLGNLSTFVNDTDFERQQLFSDYYVQSADFFRMDYMALSYLFSNMGGSRVSLRLSFTVNNAFVITDYSGLDPEVFSGIDNNIYPRPRGYVLGVNLVF